MPIKLFDDGDILTHTDVNTYFMDQALCVFENATERDNSFGGTDGLGNPTEPALAEGRICYLISDRKIYIYTKTSTDPAPEVFEWTPQLAVIEAGSVDSAKLASSLTLTTPTLGVASATSINKVAFTAPATSATLTLANGSTLATSGANSVTLTSTGTTAVTLPVTGTLATIAGSETLTNKTLVASVMTGTTSIEEIFESATIVDAQPVATNGATLTLTVTNGAVYYYTVATSHNIVLDLITTGLATNQAATVLLMVTSGATTGKISSIKVNNVTNTAKWFGGNLNPNGSGGSAVDAYTVTVFRKDSTYTVFASQSKFA